MNSSSHTPFLQPLFVLNSYLGEFPGSQVVKDSAVSLQEVQVQLLVRELRSCILNGLAKKIKEKTSLKFSMVMAYCLDNIWGILLLLFFSRSVVSDSWRPHGRQHTGLPCPSSSPRTCSYSCPLYQWFHPTISSSVVPFSSCLQSFPAPGSFFFFFLLVGG